MATQMFRTALCDVLGIDYPIVQSGMGGVAGPEMVAEVSRAGGLGILAGLNVPPDNLRRMIRRVRELTDRPFGVNLWLHPAVRTPVDVATVPGELVQTVQAALNTFRAPLDLPARFDLPASLPPILDAGIEVVLEERVPVFSTALLEQQDATLVRRCHDQGIKVLTMVARVADARAAAETDVDVIVAQGGEAGGHRSVGDKPPSPEAASVSTLALVPQVVDAVRCPVVAAGGLADGRGLVAALALGASGILLGTRFVATREATVPEFWKAALIEGESDATTITDVFTGLWARGLRNRFVEGYRATGAPVLPPLVQRSAAEDIFVAAARLQEREYFPMWSGQSVGLIRDLPGAGEVLHTIVDEARQVLDALGTRIQRA
jgi:nitronate monooxygenase